MHSNEGWGLISYQGKYLFSFFFFLPFNNICLWSRILECELSPARQLTVTMLILTLFCLRPCNVSHVLLWSMLKWGGTNLTSEIPPPDSGDSALTWHGKPMSGLWMELFQRLNAVIKANIQSIHYLSKRRVLSSPHKYVFIDSSLFKIFVLLFQDYKMDIKLFIWKAVFFSMSF